MTESRSANATPEPTLVPAAGLILRPAPRPQASARLICFPYAGGGAAAWHPWRALLPTWIELAMVQLPGREGRLRERAYTRMESAVEAIVPAVAALDDLPCVFFGHSMGALIAFATARALRAADAPTPALLIVSGRRAPNLVDPEPDIHTLADGPFVGALIRRYNAIPRVLLEDVELLRLFLPTLRADLELLETYAYTPAAPLASPMLALGGDDDSRARLADLAGWRAQTSGPFHTQQFPGGHFYINTARDALIETLVTAIGEAITALPNAGAQPDPGTAPLQRSRT